MINSRSASAGYQRMLGVLEPLNMLWFEGLAPFSAIEPVAEPLKVECSG